MAVTLSTALYFINADWAPFGQDIWQQGISAPALALLATVSTLRNFIPDYYYFLNGAWWYVGLSVQLYLVFPYLIRQGCQWGWHRLLTVSLLLSLAYRGVILLSPIGESWNIVALAFFPSRLFEFSFGIYLAMTFLKPASDLRSSATRWLNNLLLDPKFIPVSVCLFIVGLSAKWFAYPALSIFEEALIAIGLFCGLVNLSQFTFLRLGQLSQTTGKYSYGIYLTHMNIHLILWPLATILVSSYWPRFLLVMLTCCGIGIGFEVGFNRCRSVLKTGFSNGD